MAFSPRPSTLRDLRASGWHSKTVKQEIRDNFLRMLSAGEELFPGIIGYENTVIPEINLALIAGHDMLFLGEKGQAKSRLMRLLVRFLDEAVPYLDVPGCPVHEDPYRPITGAGKRLQRFANRIKPRRDAKRIHKPIRQHQCFRSAVSLKFLDDIKSN
jgi:magnesium chelatase subunit I